MIYTIKSIEWESFPPDCPPRIGEEDLPVRISLDVGDVYRVDAATYGTLAHSPYCPYCAGERQSRPAREGLEEKFRVFIEGEVIECDSLRRAIELAQSEYKPGYVGPEIEDERRNGIPYDVS